MSLGLVGRKVGMTRIFTDDGVSIPVTVLDVSNNRVAQIKTPECDGYELGGEVVKVLFLMELEGLKGRDKIAGYDVESVIKYPGK